MATEQFTQQNFARYLFGQLTQIGGVIAEVRNAGPDACIVTTKTGQKFTVTVTSGHVKEKTGAGKG